MTSVGQADTDLWKQVQVEPFADFDRVDAVLVLVRKDEQPVSAGDRRAKIALIVFVVAILQVSAFSSITIGGAGPDVLLVTLVVDRAAPRRRSPAPSPGSSPG